MSRLDELAKPTLEQLIAGTTGTLSEAQQHVLARWAIMQVIVIEWDEPRSVSFSSQRRREFFEKQKLPDDMVRVWVGRNDGDAWRAGFNHTAYNLGGRLKLTGEPIAPKTDAPNNTQVTTFGIGKSFIHCVSTEIPTFMQMMVLPTTAQIFPIENATVRWADLVGWDDSTLQKLSNSLPTFLKRLGEAQRAGLDSFDSSL